MLKKDSIFVKLVGTNIITIIIITLLLSTMNLYVSEKLVIKTFTEANAATLEQVSSNLVEFHNNIVNISNAISLNQSLKNYFIKPTDNELDLFKNLYNMMTYYKSFSPSLNHYDLTLTTVGINGVSYTSNSDSLTLPFESIKQDYFSKPSSGITPISYAFKKEGITALTSDNPVILASKTLTNSSNNALYGALFLSMDEASFRKLYTHTVAPGNTLSIISKEGIILSSSLEELIGSSAPDLYLEATNIVEQQLPYKNIKLANGNAILLSKHVPYLDVYIINTIDKGIALNYISKIKIFVFILSCIFIIITIIVVFISSNKISKPLTKMIHAMSHVSEGNFDKPLSIDGSYEVRILGNTFNTMLSKLDSYIHKLMKEQEERRKAELYALQMQIHPHFLYNTLSSIKYLAWQGHSNEIGTTIDALISLLQNTLGKVDASIPVSEELANLKNYIVILQTRYGDAIQVSFDSHPQCLDYAIPKLILQPFIENAFFHGFNISQKGTIHISIREVNHILVCEIIDNGDGMEENHVKQLLSNQSLDQNTKKRHFTGIGIANVDERIKMLYGSNYGVTITSKLNYGTCISITLPVTKLSVSEGTNS